MSMNQIAIIYHSATGTTQRLANAVADGVNTHPKSQALVLPIEAQQIEQGRFVANEVLDLLTGVDAMVFGSPTYMGSVSAQFKSFADATGNYWAEQAWANKVAAGFTIGSNLGGDQKHTLEYLQTFAGQHGMFWCGLDVPGNYDPQLRNRLGTQSGLVAHSKDGVVDEKDTALAFYLGQRVAGISHRLAST